MRGIKRFFAQLPAYVLWLMFSAVLWGWIVGLLTDTTPEKKVTLFLDVPAVEDAALSAALEQPLPEGIRMVKARAFSYVLFQQDALHACDLYVLPASEMESFCPDLLALEGFVAPDSWTKDGAVYGLRCYDADTAAGAAAAYVQYLAPDRAAEDHYICVAKNSPHIDDGAALRVALRYLELK